MADKKLMTGFKVFKGTKTQFIGKNYHTTHVNSIVYITGGDDAKNSCIFAQGTYFGNMTEFINAINYVKGVNVNGQNYNAAMGGGYVAFNVSDPSTVKINTDEKGITFGLTSDFVNKVKNTAANLGTTSDSADATGSAFARIANLADLIEDLKGDDNGSISDQIKAAIDSLRTEIVGAVEIDDSKTLAAINDELDSIISNYDTLKDRVDAIAEDYLTSDDKIELQDNIDEKVAQGLRELSEIEKRNLQSVDVPADKFGEILAEVLSYGIDEKKAKILKNIGKHIGRWIYIVDVADDIEEDAKKGRFNPLIRLYGEVSLDDDKKRTISDSLRLELLAAEPAFELIDHEKNRTVEEIINNIIYRGMPNVAEEILGLKFTDKKKKGRDGNG
jgi:hypothetical protein